MFVVPVVIFTYVLYKDSFTVHGTHGTLYSINLIQPFGLCYILVLAYVTYSFWLMLHTRFGFCHNVS